MKKIYAAICHREDLGEWIDLVIGEDGECVSCNSFDNEADCLWDMVEGTKIKLNDRYADRAEKCGVSLSYFNYEVVVLDKSDPLFLKTRELNDKLCAESITLKWKIKRTIEHQWFLIKNKFRNIIIIILDYIDGTK